MNKNSLINHIALCANSDEDANEFFSVLLDIPFVRKFNISKELAYKIFKIMDDVTVLVYENKNLKFEIFITESNYNKIFNHICLEIDNKDNLIKKCKENNIIYFYVDKEDKKLLFLKDNFGNLFEIK